MSSDLQLLSALALKTSQEMRYFEIVHIASGQERKKCLVCLGKHSMIFMRQDLNDKINKDGELMYAHIAKVVQDKESREHLLLMLNENAGWKSDHVSIRSENRDLLLSHLRCSWQTDHMWRLNKVVMFPLSAYPLTSASMVDPEVSAFLGHQWVEHRGYKFMLPDSFLEQATTIQAHNTGEFVDTETGAVVVLHVHEVMTMEQLLKANREHIRWVAAEYKASIVSGAAHFYVLRNAMRAKRMNLVSDLAAWYGWELIIRTQEATVVCMLLRRQYCPPLCDCAQDIALMLRCSSDCWRRSETRMLLQASLLADTMCPAARVSVYPELLQAKLDGLRFDEDGVEWIGNHLKMTTVWRTEAKRFLRTILKLFTDDMRDKFKPEVLHDKRFLVQATADEAWGEIETIPNADLKGFFQRLKETGEGLDNHWGDRDFREQVSNRWLARVARYFAWAVDGGLLGPRFTLDMMIEVMPSISDAESEKQVKKALLFLLHMRSQDWSEPWDGDVDLVKQLSKDDADKWSFNDRVMQQMISAEYLKKQYGREKEREYFKCLARLLTSNAGVNLKAYVCRIFMEPRAGGGGHTDDEANAIAVPSLLCVLQSGNLYLATYATAALVNLSHGNELVKLQLMSRGLPHLAVHNIKSKDDDLICYTLTLLVNLTKEAHHRFIMANAGVLPLLYDMLTSTYHQCKSKDSDGISGGMMGSAIKEKMLTHVCSLVGHFCKDEAYRDHLIDSFPHTVKCVIYMCQHASPSGQLMCKVLFALKQLCATRTDQKMFIGSHIVKPLMARLGDAEVTKSCTPEFLTHSLLLLQMLVTFRDNCVKMDEVHAQDTLKQMLKLPQGKSVENFEKIIESICSTVRDVVTQDYMT